MNSSSFFVKTCNIFPSGMVILKLLLVSPATNSLSERSFSALKRVKTYLRYATSSNRLNHLMILYVHQSLTDNLNLSERSQGFLDIKETRRSLFKIYK